MAANFPSTSVQELARQAAQLQVRNRVKIRTKNRENVYFHSTALQQAQQELPGISREKLSMEKWESGC